MPKDVKAPLPSKEPGTAPERWAEFEEVALPHMDALFRTALRMTRNREDAEDLVQETFLRAYRSFDTFEKETNCRAWLFRILTNSYINRFRRAANVGTQVPFESVESFLASDEAAETAPDAGDGADFREALDEEVKHALEELPENFRLPVVLAFVEGMSYKEIAQAMDCPIGTVMSRVFRGRQLLHKRLAPYAHAHGYREAEA